MARKARGVNVRKDGRMQKRVTINGVRYSVYGHSMKELEEKELELRQRIAEGTRITGRNITVDKYFEDWIENRAQSVKEATTRTYKALYAQIGNVAIDDSGTTFGSLRVKDVDVRQIRALQAVFLKKYSTRTANDRISLLRSVFQSAVDDDRIITFNPVNAVRRVKRTEQPARESIHRALTREETNKFLDASADSYYHNLYVFLLNTGCRIGEAAALQLRDVSKTSVHVARTITRTEAGGYKIGEDTKTAAGNRIIPTNAQAAEAIKRQRAFNRVVFGDEKGLTDTVFRSTRGKLLKSTHVNEDIKRICKAAGIEYFSVHAFRDTFCTRCVESGMPPKTLQTIMGHSDISMTLGLYAHCEQATAEAQLKAVNFN